VSLKKGEIMKFMKDEEAVSPVIGVILMVAITVILAAVIAAFVFGMSGSVAKTKSVAATATQSGNEITVVYQGGNDDPYFINATAKMNGTLCAEAGSSPADGVMLSVGDVAVCTGTPQQDHVVVIASFTDGSQQIILDAYV
jgi:flagellin-like protein